MICESSSRWGNASCGVYVFLLFFPSSRKIRRFAQSGVNADCLFRFSEPVSPHLAVRMEGVSPVSLHHYLSIRHCAALMINRIHCPQTRPS